MLVKYDFEIPNRYPTFYKNHHEQYDFGRDAVVSVLNDYVDMRNKDEIIVDKDEVHFLPYTRPTNIRTLIKRNHYEEINWSPEKRKSLFVKQTRQTTFPLRQPL